MVHSFLMKSVVGAWKGCFSSWRPNCTISLISHPCKRIFFFFNFLSHYRQSSRLSRLITFKEILSQCPELVYSGEPCQSCCNGSINNACSHTCNVITFQFLGFRVTPCVILINLSLNDFIGSGSVLCVLILSS